MIYDRWISQYHQPANSQEAAVKLLSLSLSVLLAAPTALAEQTIEDLAFLEGHWRGGEDFVFEEIWSAPEGGVMTAMARGVSDDTVRVLEYVIVAEEDGALVMRFKHFNTNYSTWEEDEAPLTLTLTQIQSEDATFTADPPSHTVTSIRYWKPDSETLQVDVAQIENGEEGGFTLVFNRVDQGILAPD